MSQYVPAPPCPEKFCPDLSQRQGVFFLTIEYFVLVERNLGQSLLRTFLKNLGTWGQINFFWALSGQGHSGTPPTLTLHIIRPF